MSRGGTLNSYPSGEDNLLKHSSKLANQWLSMHANGASSFRRAITMLRWVVVVLFIAVWRARRVAVISTRAENGCTLAESVTE